MKNKIITSALTIICVLCGAWVSDAFAAPSVRALGGAGTYTGTTSAAAAKTGGTATTSARAGSVRVTPSVTAGASTTSPSVNVNAGVPGGQRMSIGKYMGPSVTGGVNISTGGSGASAEDITELAGQIDQNAKDIAVNAAELEKLDNQINGEPNGLIYQLDSFLTKGEADTYYQPLGDYITAEELAKQGLVTDEAMAALTKRVDSHEAELVGQKEYLIKHDARLDNDEAKLSDIDNWIRKDEQWYSEQFKDVYDNINNVSMDVKNSYAHSDENLATAKKYTDDQIAGLAGISDLPSTESPGYYVWDTNGDNPQWHAISIENTWPSSAN